MKKAFFITAVLALLLCGCGAERYDFTVIDENGAHEESMVRGDMVSGPALVYTAEGEVFREEGYKLAEPLTGIITDPPEKTLMDVYELAAEALDAGERVLIIYIDGLGWDSYEKALDDGAVPNLAPLYAEKAASMYPTITPVNYAAMVTGHCPAENGVTERGIHTISCETIFDYALSLGLSSYVSEGDTQILALPGAELELSPDLNGDGTGDDEIFGCAMEAADGYELLFVHFHSVDDASHEFGPGSPEARQALVQADAWCGELMSVWDGRVIVTSDHGQHENDGTGDAAYAGRSGTHGDFAPSDIFVPLLTN